MEVRRHFVGARFPAPLSHRDSSGMFAFRFWCIGLFFLFAGCDPQNLGGVRDNVCMALFAVWAFGHLISTTRGFAPNSRERSRELASDKAYWLIFSVLCAKHSI